MTWLQGLSKLLKLLSIFHKQCFHHILRYNQTFGAVAVYCGCMSVIWVFRKTSPNALAHFLHWTKRTAGGSKTNRLAYTYFSLCNTCPPEKLSPWHSVSNWLIAPYITSTCSWLKQLVPWDFCIWTLVKGNKFLRETRVSELLGNKYHYVRLQAYLVVVWR